MIYTIEKHIAIPGKKGGFVPSKTREIAEKMEEGDSVFVAESKEASRIVNALGRLGKKSAQRKIDGGYRVWSLGKK